MGYVNSPSDHESTSKKTSLKQLKTLIFQVVRRTKEFLDAQVLPYIANKACETFLGNTGGSPQAKCRRLLQTRLELNPTQLHRFFHTSLGKDLLSWMERFFHLPSDRDNEHTLRELLVQMASDPAGLSFLSFFHRSPDPIRLNIEQLLLGAKRVELLLRATDATIGVIRDLSATEAAPLDPAIPATPATPGIPAPDTPILDPLLDTAILDSPTPDPATLDPATLDPATQDSPTLDPATLNTATVNAQHLGTETHSEPDFSQFIDICKPGSFTVKRYSLVFGKKHRDYLPDHAYHPHLCMECYQPHPLPDGEIPVIVQSHGLASNPEDLAIYAEHLASYGYFVAAPCHSGSDAEQVRNMLAGESQEVFHLTEFIDRPLDISYLLDELERRNADEFEGRLNLKSVGMMGYSFGAYTAFALAGADINFDKLELACGIAGRHPNISLLLQCQALGLPRQTYNLHDDRIQAVLSIDSVGSEVFGARGIEKIQVPVLLIAGSQDIAAPLALEQIRLFHWLTSPHHYLALMQGKSHIQDVQRLVRNLELEIKLSPSFATTATATPFEEYTKALVLSFFNQHLWKWAESIPRLSAKYAAYLSRSPFELWLISQRSNNHLKQKLQALNNHLIAEIMEFEAEVTDL